MADYFTPTVVQPFIAATDLTSLELLILCAAFGSEPANEAIYFYAEDAINEMPILSVDALQEALGQSPAEMPAARLVREHLADEQAGPDIDLDLTGAITWATLFQDIVRRSNTIDHVVVTSSFTCSKMRPDGFGGAVVLITAERVLGKGTDTVLDELLAEAGLGSADAVAQGVEGGQ